MNLRQLGRSILSEAGWTLAAGISFLMLAVVVLTTGKIRLVAIGEAKYPLAAVIFLFGAYVAYLGVIAVAARYRELRSKEK